MNEFSGSSPESTLPGREPLLAVTSTALAALDATGRGSDRVLVAPRGPETVYGLRIGGAAAAGAAPFGVGAS